MCMLKRLLLKAWSKHDLYDPQFRVLGNNWNIMQPDPIQVIRWQIRNTPHYFYTENIYTEVVTASDILDIFFTGYFVFSAVVLEGTLISVTYGVTRRFTWPLPMAISTACPSWCPLAQTPGV